MELKSVDGQIQTSKRKIKREVLNKSRYTVSLLKEGLRMGLIDKGTIELIETQIMFILKDLIIRYTKGESTSVAVDTAERLLNSVFYSIDAFTGSFMDPEEGLAILKTTAIKEIYEKGIEMVNTCVKESQCLYREIKRRKLDISNEAYNDTLNEALPLFFEKYGVMFGAQDTTAMIDYPLVFDDIHCTGIFYIKRYLEHLEIETVFCRLFSKEHTEKVLASLGRTYGIDWRKSLINIFEVLVNNAVFSVLAGFDAGRIIISNSEYHGLKARLSGLNLSEISLILDGAIEKIIKDFKIDQTKLLDYMHQYKSILAVRISNAVQNESLENIILTGEEERIKEHRIILDGGDRLTDASFRLLIRRILKCKNAADKVNMILSQIHSSEDFMDVLQADCLFEDEFWELFCGLSDMELAVLGKFVFYEELREESLDFSSITIADKEIEWQKQYIRFIQSLDGQRGKAIGRFLKEIQLANESSYG